MPQLSSRAMIAAIPYAEGAYPDHLLEGLARELQGAGHILAGVIQHDLTRRDRSRCDMALEDLTSGIIIGLSEDRGPAARGCRIDPDGLAKAAALIDRALQQASPVLLIVNKFGKIESEGGGLREAIAAAVCAGIPVVVGVPMRNLDAWEAFAGALADRLPANHEILVAWINARLEGRTDSITQALPSDVVLPIA